ncbi:uncharacterized [Tachysurus ichikawai]
MNVNASPLPYTSGANYTDKLTFLDFLVLRSLFSSSHSSSLAVFPSLSLPDTWRQLRDVTSKSSVPWASRRWKTSAGNPSSDPPSLDFPPSSHY